MAPPSRRPKNKHNPSHDTKITRRLRIVYDDPDATDNSSDEDEHFEKPKKIKRIVRELALPTIGNTVSRGETSGESSSYNELNKAKAASLKREPSCKYRGVRMRKWGSWAAEIRNPMIKRGREWIGTFNTAEEASRAYEKRYLEIREEMAKSEKMKSSNNNNVTNPEKSSYDYFVSSDHSLDDSESDMSHTSSSFLPELNTSDFNLIENGNVSSNEAVETNVLEGEFANLEGEFADLAGEFAELNMPDLSVLDMQPLPLSPPPVVGAANPSRFEFDCLTFDGFGECYDDLGGLEDIQICGIDDNGPIELPDFDFDDFGADEIAGWIEEPHDIPCL